MKRKKWIDFARGLCMMAILYDHTEIYYTGDNIIPYHLYVSNALITFYFISGYLFYKGDQFEYSRKIKSIIKTIIIPYFIFTSLIALPKAWIHGNEIESSDILKGIISGQASWFVAALAIAEIIFSTLLYIYKDKKWHLLAFSVSCFLLSIILSKYKVSFPWQINNALQAVFFIYLGYVYHTFEENKQYVYSKQFILISTLLLILIKVYEEYAKMNMFINPIVIDNYLVFLIDFAFFTICIIQLCKYIERKINNQSTWFRMISWTGSHSLVYYFLCGGVPLTVSMIMNKMNYTYEGHYERIIIAFISVYVITTIVVWMIYRYIPQITGKR